MVLLPDHSRPAAINLPLLSHRFDRHSLPYGNHRRCRTRLRVLSFAAALGALAPTVPLPAADLVVQGTNSPYAFTTGTASYDNIYVGETASGTLNQSGGTLVPTASRTTFLQGLTTANVQAGGAVINTNGFNVTVAQSLLHDTTAGASAADGV